jgi:hypothetical protein
MAAAPIFLTREIKNMASSIRRFMSKSVKITPVFLKVVQEHIQKATIYAAISPLINEPKN